ncbi:MAG: hypothetical protein HYR93_03765 [Chloroflexi bacterium]|nr:hypothetical protein [Chloroflexota bacterium]MBI3340522.1 hypothetical protein [Chloroflexota bacterium]
MKNKLALSALLALAILLAACAPQSTAEPAATAAPAPTEAPYSKGGATAAAPTNDYNYSYGNNAVSPSETPASQSNPSSGVTVMVAQNNELGPYLVNSQGMTLYLLTSDSAATSTCSGGCASNWPPLTVTGAPTAGDGVDAALFGTLVRADGATQVTYNGHPLYTYKNDAKPGDTNGQGAGGVWFTLTPKGSPIK